VARAPAEVTNAARCAPAATLSRADSQQCAPMTTAEAGARFQRDFYLQEFRGRTLGIACPAGQLRDAEELAAVVQALARNDTNVLLLSSRRDRLEAVVGERVLPASTLRLETAVWRALRQSSRLGILCGGRRPFALQVRELALRLGVYKLVWIDPQGGMRAASGERLSFVHQDELRQLLANRRRIGRDRVALLREVDRLLSGGLQAVNICTLAGLREELFTYTGSGTLFTRKRYIAVRDLGLDDFDAAYDLIGRGVEEGFLASRPAREIDQILASGFGAFVEGSHLAGIGALLPYPEVRAGEIASLYTLTRFLGEGVGQHLVRYALRQARALRLRWVFACTTQDRVGAFFERQGFEAIPLEDLPARKWSRYDQRRRRQLLCYRRELAARRRRKSAAAE
jgi:N-acetylglutamate synthase-like GNAT family acetyltransferase